MTSRSPEPVAVVVDGYSTGGLLPAAFHRLGVRVVHVQSTAELVPGMVPPDLDDYLANIVCADDASIADCVARLAEYQPIAVLAGQQLGVQLADRLSTRLGLPSNGSALSAARGDKYRLIEEVRAAGLRCAAQLRGERPEDLVGWAEQNGSYPVVVKPLSPASTDNGFLCRDAGEVRAAAEHVLGGEDAFGTANGEALVQSYLPGAEYIVDTVSLAGQRYVCGVWEHEKRVLGEGRSIDDKDVLCDPYDAPVVDLIAYVDQVLDALDIRYGPAHAEVKLTPRGPALVAIGARLSGTTTPGFHDACVGANQAELTALAYADPEAFRRRYATRIYRKHQDALVHNTSTTREGEIVGIRQAVVDKLESLPTVFGLSVRLTAGQQLRPTVDLSTSPLRVFMTGQRDELRGDYQVIQDLKDDVYILAY